MQTYEIIAGYAQDNGIEKFDVSDLNDELMGWAIDYTANYQGTFGFMLDMVQTYRQYGNLSRGQAKGVLNCALAESRFAKKTENFSFVRKPAERVVPNGTYTVVFPDQDYRTIRIKDDFRGDQPEGSQMAEYLVGPDNTKDFVGFAFVAGTDVKLWAKFKQDTVLANALRILFDDPEEAGHAYAMQSGNCYRCGRPLTVPASLNRGLGPVCAEKV